MRQAQTALSDPPAQHDLAVPSLESSEAQSTRRTLLHHPTVQHHKKPIRKILVATDFSANSDKALKLAANLAGHFEAALAVLHVIDVNSRVLSGKAADLMNTLREQASLRMGQLVWSLGHEMQAQPLVIEGLPWEEIVNRSEGFDLVVLGQGRSHLRCNPFASHTTQRVIKNSPCPVLLVPT